MTETRGQGIVIQGTGFFLSRTFARQNVAIVGADRAILSGVTVKNPDAQGYGVWIESTSPAILDNTFTESGHDGVSVTGNGSPLIRNNYFLPERCEWHHDLRYIAGRGGGKMFLSRLGLPLM